MLQTLIKRDGTTEPLIHEKLYGWSEWAAGPLGGRVDWSIAAKAAVEKLPEVASTRDLMMALIGELLSMENWPAYLMAGRLRASVIRKDLYGSITPPTVYEQHNHMLELDRMRALPYSKEEYEEIEKFVDHTKDYHYPEFALSQIVDKYSLRNYVTNEIYETPQFTYIRMAMTIAEFEPADRRLEVVKDYYTRFSDKLLSAPTPNYLYLGTKHNGYASCCIYASGDDGKSLGIGNWIADQMTINSAGLGSHTHVRAPGDPIDGGRVKHAGKFRYTKAKGAATLANKQAARAGAGTDSFMCFEPEADQIVQYRNPMLTAAAQIRELHFNMLSNKWFAAKVANGGEIFTFSQFTAPDLFDAFFSPDINEFVRLYLKYEADPNFKKTYIKARKMLGLSYSEAYDTGTAYHTFIDEVNRHTPYIITPEHRIHCGNLCNEVYQIQAPYYEMTDLYRQEDHGRGEISMCNLAAIPIDNIGSNDLLYYKSAYAALKMVDYTILHGRYPFPHLEYTAKQRMNAGVGIMGLATHMARKNLRWDTQEGLQEIHAVFERHMYWLIKASIAISKERGLAPWMHKTKWPQGWTPLDTYNRGVDEIGDFVNNYDWEALKQEIIENGGIGHSVLSCMMPGESSSKALASTNSILPIRSVVITKKDGENNISRWAAVDGDLLGDRYHFAYDIKPLALIKVYGVAQKWTDSGISADTYRRLEEGEVSIPMEEWVEHFLAKVKYGIKGTYYTNTQRPKVRNMKQQTSLVDPVVARFIRDAEIAATRPSTLSTAANGTEYEETEVEDGCAGGFCKM